MPISYGCHTFHLLRSKHTQRSSWQCKTGRLWSFEKTTGKIESFNGLVCICVTFGALPNQRNLKLK